jgi:L-lactate dehydrogenase complex protein LldE
MTQDASRRPRVGLFVTCLVDVMRPAVGFAAVRLLEAAGCQVVVPAAQTCCGQPAYNSGDRQAAKALALAVIASFEDFDYVVAPSGSCAAMLKVHYPKLMDGDAANAARATAFAERVHELTSFLVDVRGFEAMPGAPAGRLAYHDGCAGLRELGLREQPRKLIARMAGTELVELANRDTCCGFGGLFCVKYPDVSNAMVSAKTAAVDAASPDTLVAGELGCLLNIAGKLAREGSPVACRHVAEVLAGDTLSPPIAHGSDASARRER